MMARMGEICKIVAEASWHQFSAHLLPPPSPGPNRGGPSSSSSPSTSFSQLDTFIHLTSAYGDVLDSLARHDECETFWRYVVEEMMPPPLCADQEPEAEVEATTPVTTVATIPLDRGIRLELNLILALRRRQKYPEALRRLERIHTEVRLLHKDRLRDTSHEEEDGGDDENDDDENIVELTYEVLRIHGLCEVNSGGDVHKGRRLLWEAFEWIQEKEGKYSPRTTRALREVVRWGEPDEVLVREFEERLAKSGLETENF